MAESAFALLVSAGKVLSTILILYPCLLLLLRRYWSPLSKFPGPFWGSVTNLYAVYAYFTGKQHLIQYELHKKYGPIVRYMPGLLIVDDPTALPTIYHRHVDKTSFYQPILGVTTVFSTQENKAHAMAWKRIADAYSVTTSRQVESKIDSELARWTEYLHDECENGRNSVDLRNQTTRFSYDLMAQLIIGRRLDSIGKNGDSGRIIAGSRFAGSLHQIMALMPGLSWLLRNTWPARKFLEHIFSKDSGSGVFLAEIESLVRSQDESLLKPSIFVRCLMDVESEDGSRLSPKEISSEARIMLIAGAEPVADTITNLIMNISSRPDCCERLLAEIDSAEPSSLLSQPIASFKDARGLPLFNACLQETLRGAPSTTSLFPRQVAIGGTRILGQFVPEGTQLSATPWITNRNRALYGGDAEMFRPERWLKGSPEQVREWIRYDFQFGYGNRACPGKNLALMIVYKASLHLLRTCRLRLEEPTTSTFTPRLDTEQGRTSRFHVERRVARKAP